MGWWKNSKVTSYLTNDYDFTEELAIYNARLINQTKNLPGTHYSLRQFTAQEIAAWLAMMECKSSGGGEDDEVDWRSVRGTIALKSLDGEIREPIRGLLRAEFKHIEKEQKEKLQAFLDRQE